MADIVILGGGYAGLGAALQLGRLGLKSTLLEAEPDVIRHRRPRSLYFGPNEVLVNIEANFADHLSADDIELTVDRIEAAIREASPIANRIFIEADRIRPSPVGGPSARTA